MLSKQSKRGHLLATKPHALDTSILFYRSKYASCPGLGRVVNKPQHFVSAHDCPCGNSTLEPELPDAVSPTQQQQSPEDCLGNFLAL